MKMFRLGILFSLAIAMFAMPAEADMITFGYNTVITGSAPGGAAPWLTAKFEDDGVGVKLTIATPGLTSTEFVTWVAFNFSPDSSLGSLLILPGGGQSATFTKKKDDVPNDNCCGDYDILFEFPNSGSGDRFVKGETSIWNLAISGIDLSPAAFDVVDPRKGFLSAAHVQGIECPVGTTSCAGSGKVRPGESVPEPGSLLLLGSGLLGLGVIVRRQTR